MQRRSVICGSAVCDREAQFCKSSSSRTRNYLQFFRFRERRPSPLISTAVATGGMIITEVNSFVDLVSKLFNFAHWLQDGWYRGSADVASFRDQVLILTRKHYEWSAQLRRHGLSEDEHFLQAVQAAVQVLDQQEKYVRQLQKNRLRRLTKKAFPGELSYSLNRILAIVDAGPQLLAGRVSNHDLMERSRAQSPALLPFIADSNYVPILRSIVEILKALEDQEGPRVVTLFGGPGLGKSSMVKYLPLLYEEEKSHWVRGTQPKTISFPDGVFYLFCGKGAQDKVKQLQLELLECLGFGTGSTALPEGSTSTEVQEGGSVQVPSHQRKLRSCIAEQKLLIVLDDVWEQEVLNQLLVPAKGVKYLITSQIREIWDPAARIQMRDPSMKEARQIMSNYTKGLPTKGKFPENIQAVADTIIEKLDYHPLSLADIGVSINSSRATDYSHWEAVSDNIQAVLDDNDHFQGSPVVYDQPYNLTVKASMMLMVESLHAEARRLLFLIALFGGKHVPETVVRYFYKLVQTHQNSNLLLKYNNEEKYLEERSLVELHMNPGEESTLAAHGLRMHYIREHRTLDVRSIASHILANSEQAKAQLIQMGDAESTLVTILSTIYFTKPFGDDVVNTFENHLRILTDGVISRNTHRPMDPLDFAITRKIKKLVPLLHVDHGDHGWKQQAHEHVKKIIIKLAYSGGELDDCSMARLLELPQTTTAGCDTLSSFEFLGPMLSQFAENGKTFSNAHEETMNTLLTLFHDDATSTKIRVAVAGAVMWVLNFETKDTIVNVVSKFTNFLAMDCNPTLQIGLAKILFDIVRNSHRWQYPINRIRLSITIGEFTASLEVLMRLLVFGKDFEVRVSAGTTIDEFCRWKCTALKIAAIPDVLDNLFDLFLSKESLPKTLSTREVFCSPSYLAGCILTGLSCVEENRMRFRAHKRRLDGLGNILTSMQKTWRSIPQEEERKELEKRADIAARILGELGLEKELRDYIGSLPGIEGGLLFFQTIEMARAVAETVCGALWFHLSVSARPLAILYCNYSNPELRDVPFVKRLQELLPHDITAAEPSFIADVCKFTLHWTRVLAHSEMGAYKSALENLDVAQHHLDQIQTPDVMDQILKRDDMDQVNKLLGRLLFLKKSNTYDPSTGNIMIPTDALSCTRMFLLAMLEDYAGALLQVQKAGGSPSLALTRRAFVKRLSRDLPGALKDLNAAHNLDDYLTNMRYDVLKHRGYVKHLMGDDIGAKEDAEAAQRLRFTNFRALEETIDCRSFWDFTKLRINYLGYVL